MKKIAAMLLVLALLPTMLLPAFAVGTQAAPSDAAAQTAEQSDACPYPIVFVTGIGQTWGHLQNADGSYKSNVKKRFWAYNWIWGEDEPIEYNIFYPDSLGLREPACRRATLRLAAEFLLSILLNRNYLRQADVETVLRGVFHYHVLNEKGELPSDVEDPIRPYPLSEYNERDLRNFYHSIPCRFMVDKIGADQVFCFYHNAFSNLYDDAQNLHTFIRDVVLKQYSDAEKVILIPMSMGAAVTNAYFDLYPDADEVKDVVSIVGAWDGSDVVADLIEGKYASDAPELLYYTLWPQLYDKPDKPDGYIFRLLLRLVPKQTLREMIDTAMPALTKTLILRTPSLMALVPAARYPAIEQQYMQGDEWASVREQTHRYYEAQRDLQPRLAALEEKGIGFYFLCGYGLGFGGADGSGFPYMQFMQSAKTTNSDEIIQISSTAPGARFAPAGQSLGRTGAYVSPDGSVDLSTSFAPDRTWCFYRQKHELEYNNTALRLAFAIAAGEVTDVASSADVYPQFNQARDVESIIREYKRVPYTTRLETYIRENEADAAKQANVARARDMLVRVNAMLDNTHNDPETDNAVAADCKALLIELGLESEGTLSASGLFWTRILRTICEYVYTKNPPF